LIFFSIIDGAGAIYWFVQAWMTYYDFAGGVWYVLFNVDFCLI